MSNSRGRVLGVLLVVLVLVAAAAGGGYFYLESQFNSPGPSRTAVRIEVEQGSTVHGALNQLAKQGALRSSREVTLYLRIQGRRPRMEVGTYEIPAGASPKDIIEMFEQGRVVLEQLTIIEGSTFADFRRTLDAHPAVTHTLTGKTAAQVMAALGHPDEKPEGRFFPDTYRFAAKTPDLEILTVAYATLQKVLQSAWQQHAANLPYDTPYQALIMASIVEKETGLAADRPRIAGVFVNRLRKGMRLQSDPTVIYGLGEQYDGTIHTRDLTTDTPYNSYTRGGLPPTPIALPGRESILAAVLPLDTGDLYFVATGLGDGSHHFSKTLEEHNEAVQTYLTRLKAQQAAGKAGAQ